MKSTTTQHEQTPGNPAAWSANQTFLVLCGVNLLAASLWAIFLPAWGTVDYTIGFVVGALALSIYERAYGQRLFWLAQFTGFVLWEIVVSNLRLAWLLVQPRLDLRPGIIAAPLRVTSGLEITVLATIITLTPGTLSIDLARTPDGTTVLYVHNFIVDDPDAMRASIRDDFERRLLLVTRGTADS
jgi:multicomponent Na+:H+ antiporter subunit E